MKCVGNRSSSHIQRTSAWWASDPPPWGKINLPLFAPSFQHSFTSKNFFFILFLTIYSQWAAWFSYYKKKKISKWVQVYTLLRIYPLYGLWNLSLWPRIHQGDPASDALFSLTLLGTYFQGVEVSKHQASTWLRFLCLGADSVHPLPIPRGWQVFLLWCSIQKLSSIFVQKATTF